LTMIPSTIVALVVHVAAALSCLADGRTGLYSVIETPHTTILNSLRVISSRRRLNRLRYL
jgi:hypothetical protein